MEKRIQASQPDLSSEKELPWLQDVNQAVQILTGLSLRFSAQAALITRNEALWAYAGQLPQEAATELGKAVVRYWDRNNDGDLMRFIRLETTSAEHKLYATHLAKDMVVALVFDSETPFNIIRSQAVELVRSLSSSPNNENDIKADLDDSKQLNINTLKNILAHIPSTNPTRQVQPDQQENEKVFPNPTKDPPPSIQQATFSQEPSPDISAASATYSELLDGGDHENPNQSPFSETGRRVRFEQSAQAMYNLNYACLLIPRLPNHFMTGDLSVRLSEWIPKLCIAFAWRLEYISISPDYLQWIVNVPPTTAPGFLMRIVRQHISEKIFAEFPRLKNDNPSGDFWAPGYVLMGGTHPHPAQLVKDFIQQTRLRQGIS
ncbi:MAG: hypothetical protein A2X25_09970 [Chloroflexi bacterium GWB2_49_20]|nr:MAG: hypothetical protein A2X25_09970 [Chloroflexi bacterium GWB2_49_20]OGN79252.1 MAG: hypothetical protein A2X26_04055 [Chloroflexi bacterium GWC2_49_37]OGN82978.1 MAG: hypothetical protein A2X27_08640 [Chloroflexi bacterium GWD2_49_16]HCC78634.1 hypothetical protein [Anaerolineae bacterium]